MQENERLRERLSPILFQHGFEDGGAGGEDELVGLEGAAVGHDADVEHLVVVAQVAEALGQAGVVVVPFQMVLFLGTWGRCPHPEKE